MTYPNRHQHPRSRRSLFALAVATFTVGAAAQSVPDPGYFLRHDTGTVPVGVSILATVALDLDGDLRDDVAMLGSDGGIRIAHDPGVMMAFSHFRPGIVFTGVSAVERVGAGDPEYLITADAVNGLAAHHLVGSGVVTTLAPDTTWAGFGGLVVRHFTGTNQSLVVGFLPGSKSIRAARYVHGVGFLNLTAFQAADPVRAIEVVNWDPGTVPEIAVLSATQLQIKNLAGGTLASFSCAGSAGSMACPDSKSIAWFQPSGPNGVHRVRLLRQAGAVFDQTMTFSVASGSGGPSVLVGIDAIASGDLTGDGVADIALGQNDVPHVLMLRGIASDASTDLIGFDPALVVDPRNGVPNAPSDAHAPAIGQFDNHYPFQGVATTRYGVDGSHLSLDLDAKVADVVQQNLGGGPWGLHVVENLTQPQWVGTTRQLELRLKIPGWILSGMTHLEAEFWRVDGTHNGGPVTLSNQGLGVQSWTLHTSNDPDPLVFNLHSAQAAMSTPFVGETWAVSLNQRPHLLALVRVVKRNATSGALESAIVSFPIVTTMGLYENAEQSDPTYDDFLDSLPPFYPGLTGTECVFDARNTTQPGPPYGVRKHIGKMKMPLPVVPPSSPAGTAPIQGSSAGGTGSTSPN